MESECFTFIINIYYDNKLHAYHKAWINEAWSRLSKETIISGFIKADLIEYSALPQDDQPLS